MGVSQPTLNLIGGGIQAGSTLLGGIADFKQSGAETEQMKASYEINKQRMEKQQNSFEGSQIASVGASGVELSGSALDVINESMYNFELDQAIAKENYSMQRTAQGSRGGQDLLSGALSAVSTGLGAFGKYKTSKMGPLAGSQDMGTYTKLPSGWNK